MSVTLNGRAPISTYPKTADFALKEEFCGTCHTNEGAAGAVTFALPPATPGLHYSFSVETAQPLRIDPNGAETISLPSTGVPGAAGKYLTSSTVGATVRLVCAKAGSWRVQASVGNWTAEA